ncbi:D-aminoacyl-tRNA deacylase [Butyrivibrio sp. AE2032]|uniref:D-aminoacyl-tRNA deacylase n=1 Tax=Butyrivibrio sp. AE2032 TaxID=1458463 RepID=UPI00054D2D9D|nr:D-aminoacyl-tRNA deacylase [Butyrivibrio sp. AE2032]
MRFCIQVVKQASVDIDGETVSSIGPGMLVLCGVGKDDDEAVADKMIAKLLKLRIFSDENGKTNLSLTDIGGEMLLVSQFTLYADCKHGNRPSFTDSMGPQRAEELYNYIADTIRPQVKKLGTGVFGADMQVSLINDGPFTVILDSAAI